MCTQAVSFRKKDTMKILSCRYLLSFDKKTYLLFNPLALSNSLKAIRHKWHTSCNITAFVIRFAGLDTKRTKKCAILSLTINCATMSIILFCFMLCLLHEALFNKNSVTFKRWHTAFLHSGLKKMCSSSHPECNC